MFVMMLQLTEGTISESASQYVFVSILCLLSRQRVNFSGSGKQFTIVTHEGGSGESSSIMIGAYFVVRATGLIFWLLSLFSTTIVSWVSGKVS